MSEVRGNWNAFAASSRILSLSRRSRPQVNDQRRKAKTGEAGSESDMFGDEASVAAE